MDIGVDTAGGHGESSTRPSDAPSHAQLAFSNDQLAGWNDDLAADDAAYAAHYPGTPPAGVVHTVYLPAPAFSAGAVGDWGARAIAAIDEFPAQWRAVLTDLDAGRGEVDRLDALTRAKLATEPIEDLRIDFEDGFRAHRGTAADDADEDAQVHRVATLVAASASMPRSWGVRIRSLTPDTRRRGLRTLDLFLGTVLAAAELPPGFVITLPKVTSPEQVRVFVEVLRTLETAHHLVPGTLTFEIQVETPQTVLGPDGRVPLAEMVRIGGRRVSGLHFGTYDYSASLGILGAYQDLRHPVADFAKSLMLLAAAETGVRVSDGSDNVVPVGDAPTVQARWLRHGQGVQRALRQGIGQGWDLHPAQLPSRFAATFAFYRDGWVDAASRLAAYDAGRPTPGGVLDEPATAFALARHLDAALVCGAVEESELSAASGLTVPVVHGYLRRGAAALGSQPRSR